MMSDARKILFHELHCLTRRTPALMKGVERLALAFEFGENPLNEVHLCPKCECFCMETHADGSFKCMNCDHHWS